MKKLLNFTLFAALTTQVFAAEDIHLKTLESSVGLLEQKTDAITLDQAKEMAVGENVDARIAYQNLYQAHQRIHQARATYFPYGAGDIAVLYLTNFWNPLILAELVTSVPSKWYNVQKHKHLRNAEAFRLQSLKENVKNQVAQLYYAILKEDTVLELTGYEVRLLEELVRALEVQVQTGFATVDELDDVEYTALKIRDEYLKLKGYLAVEKAALKMVLNSPYDGADLKFQPVKDLLDNQSLVIDTEALVVGSLERSYEMKAAQEVVNAAYKSKRSEQWSILSFTGLGFNYLERIRYAGSKIDQAILQKEALERNIENEVYSRENVLRNAIDITHSQKTIMENSKQFMTAQLAKFQSGSIVINDLIEADLYFVRDFRKMVAAHYDSLARLDDLERIALGNVESEIDSALIQIEHQENTDNTEHHPTQDIEGRR